MNIQVVKSGIEEKSIIDDLMQLYLPELGDHEKNKSGRYEYKYLDNYWKEPNRHPFFIKVDENVAGFVLVDEKDFNAEPDYPLGITEFFVLKEYRKQAVGEKVAQEIFGIFQGRWSIREKEDNKSAQEFWRKVIDRYTNGNYKEVISNNERWRGPVQLFDNSKTAH